MFQIEIQVLSHLDKEALRVSVPGLPVRHQWLNYGASTYYKRSAKCDASGCFYAELNLNDGCVMLNWGHMDAHVEKNEKVGLRHRDSRKLSAAMSSVVSL